jgi:hypothetical protein
VDLKKYIPVLAGYGTRAIHGRTSPFVGRSVPNNNDKNNNDNNEIEVWDGGMWTGFIWLRVRTNSRPP